MDLQVVPRRILYLTDKFDIPKTCVDVSLGGIYGHFGATGGRAFRTGGALESTISLFQGDEKRILSNATSYPYKVGDPLTVGKTISNAIKKMMYKLAQYTKNENIFVFITGGLGHGATEDSNLVERSHNLFYDIVNCIKELLPKEEGLNPKTTIIWGIKDIWGKKSSETPTSVYVNNGSFTLANPILSKLFENQKREYTQEELRNILRHVFEIVEISDDVLIIPQKNYKPHKTPQEYMLRNS